MKKSEELKNKIAQLQEELKDCELKENRVPYTYVPYDGQEYFFITDEGIVSKILWNHTQADYRRLSIGNIYKTSDEALFEVERLRVIAELKKYSKEFKYSEDNYCIYMENKNFRYDCRNEPAYKTDTLFFETPKISEIAIKEVGEERIKKYYFGF